MKYSLTINQLPVPQARPRVTQWGTYDPKYKEKKKYKAEINKKWLYLPCTEGLELNVVIVLPIPRSYGRRKICAIEENDYIHVIKPDASNFLKFIEDCMTGIVYKDDSQIYYLQARKKYGENPRLDIDIETKEKLKIRY